MEMYVMVFARMALGSMTFLVPVVSIGGNRHFRRKMMLMEADSIAQRSHRGQNVIPVGLPHSSSSVPNAYERVDGN